MSATVYIAGPMRGRPLFNFPAFDRVAKLFRDLGFRVISPAEMDREIDGTDAAKKAAHGFETYMRRDLRVILEECHGIVLLEGWEGSLGANVELTLARALGLVVFQEDGAYAVPAPEPFLFGPTRASILFNYQRPITTGEETTK